ncbi:Ig-like domain-containing protein, partial [Vibrio halioticoli]
STMSPALTVTVDTHTAVGAGFTDTLIGSGEQAKTVITGHVEEGAHLDTLVITDSAGNHLDVDTTGMTIDGHGDFSIAVDLTKGVKDKSGAATQLVDGDLTVSASSTDKAGNTATSTPTHSTLDTGVASPTVSFESTGKDSIYNSVEVGSDGTVTATITPNTDAKVGDTLTYTVASGVKQTHTLTATDLTQGVNIEVRPGDIVTATVTDAAGNTSKDASGTAAGSDLVVGTPAVDLNAASDTYGINTVGTDTDNITKDTTPTFTLNGIDTDATSVEVFVDDKSVGTAMRSGTDWTFTAAHLADGDYKITAKVTDSAGNTSNSSPALAVTVDTDINPVTLTLQNSSNSGDKTDHLTHGENFDDKASKGDLIFDLSAVDKDIDPSHSGVVVKDATGHEVAGSFIQVNGQWEFHTTTSELPDGDHTLHTVVTDIAGNSVEGGSTLVTVDTSASATISVGSINGGNPINEVDAKGKIQVSGIVGGDASVGDHISIEINGHVYSNVLVEKGNVFNLDVDGSEFTTDINGQTVTSSEVNATVTGTDAAGNSFTATNHTPATAGGPSVHNGQFWVDTHAGTIAVDTDLTANKDDVLNLAEQGQDLVISGRTTGIEDGQHVTVEFNGHKYGDATSGTAIEVHGNQWILTVPHADLVGIKDGASLEITPSVSDRAGNPATVTDGHLTTDLHADAGITINRINGGVTINANTGDITVTGTVSGDVKTGETVTLDINGYSHTALVGAGHTFTAAAIPATHFTTDASGQAVTSGEVKATVTGTDTAGNSVTVTNHTPALAGGTPVHNGQFSVDTDITPVTLTLQESSNSGDKADHLTHGNHFDDTNHKGDLVFDLSTIDKDIDPKNGGIVVKDSADHIVNGSFKETNGKWEFHTDTTALPEGDHTLHVSATDTAGNNVDGSVTAVTVDTKAGISITHVANDDIIDGSEITNGFTIS